MSSYGKRIKTLRESRNITQRELAELVNVHQTQISFIERGVRGASFDLMREIARALEVPIAEFDSSDEPEAVPA